MRILVVDDHDALRKSMVDALARQEDVALVDGAANGAEALKLLCQRSYDVMVTDIIMPVMDGYTLMQEMRKLMPSPAPKVIVATALARDDFVMRAVELGAKFYLVKPFQPDILLGHIRRLARGEEAMPAVARMRRRMSPAWMSAWAACFLRWASRRISRDISTCGRA